MSGVLPNGTSEQRIADSQSTSSIWNCFGLCRRGKTEAGKMPHGQSVSAVVTPEVAAAERSQRAFNAALKAAEGEKTFKAAAALRAANAALKGKAGQKQRMNVVEKLRMKMRKAFDGVDRVHEGRDFKIALKATKAAKKTVTKEELAAVGLVNDARAIAITNPAAPEQTARAVPAAAAAEVPVAAAAEVPAAVATAPVVPPEDQVAVAVTEKKPRAPRGFRELRALGINPELAINLVRQQAQSNLVK